MRTTLSADLTGVEDPDPENGALRLLEWLSTAEAGWLVVLDDVQNPAASKHKEHKKTSAVDYRSAQLRAASRRSTPCPAPVSLQHVQYESHPGEHKVSAPQGLQRFTPTWTLHCTRLLPLPAKRYCVSRLPVPPDMRCGSMI